MSRAKGARGRPPRQLSRAPSKFESEGALFRQAVRRPGYLITAAVAIGSLKMRSHSLKTRLLVIITERRS